MMRFAFGADLLLIVEQYTICSVHSVAMQASVLVHVVFLGVHCCSSKVGLCLQQLCMF